MMTDLHAGKRVSNVIRVAIALLGALTISEVGANPTDPLLTLAASDGFHRDGFGLSMAVSNNILLIGATDYDYGTQNYGSAYLFDATTGQQLQKLTPSDSAMGDQFGYSVAISGNIAIIGGIRGATRTYSPGAAYVFDVTTGQQLAKLIASDAQSGDLFGSAIAISGNRVIVGAIHGGSSFWCGFGCSISSGAAYIFDLTSGQQLFKLLPSDPQSSDKFGSSVAISGDKLIVGAWGNIQQGVHGAAYVFDVNTGQQLFKLSAPPHPGDNFDLDFGYSVALNGNFAVIGARQGLDDGNLGRTGSAYLYDLTTGEQVLKLMPSGLQQNDGFGSSVAINDNSVLVGAVRPTSFSMNLTGKAYLFDRNTGEERATFGNAECDVVCGYSVALSHDTALVGNPFFYDQGHVYVFAVIPEPASLSIAAIGLAIAALLARKRHRSSDSSQQALLQSAKPSFCSHTH